MQIITEPTRILSRITPTYDKEKRGKQSDTIAPKRLFKNLIYHSNFFEELGLFYIGPINGNDYAKTEQALVHRSQGGAGARRSTLSAFARDLLAAYDAFLGDVTKSADALFEAHFGHLL